MKKRSILCKVTNEKSFFAYFFLLDCCQRVVTRSKLGLKAAEQISACDRLTSVKYVVEEPQKFVPIS